MDDLTVLDKEGIIKKFRIAISSMLPEPFMVPAEPPHFYSLFSELVNAVDSSALTLGEAAEVFDELNRGMDNLKPRLWINNVEVYPDDPTLHHAKEALSFRAERFFRARFREKIESRDLPGKMEFITETLEAINRHPMSFGQSYVLPALEYLNEEFGREYNRRKKTRKRRGILGENLEEPERPNKFTRKQAIYLLQELIPEFKTADNTRKAQFIAKLTGYTSTKSIADEFSNIRNFADPLLLEEWRGKFTTTGRGRKKNNP